MSPKTILALDLATQLGWACGAPGATPEMGSISLRSKTDHDGAKYCLLIDWLYPMLTQHKPFRVIYEAPMMMMPEGKTDEETGRRKGGNAKTMAALIGYACHVDMLCCRLDIPVVKMTSQSARKAFLGHGFPPDPKAAVMAECLRRSWKPVDHNAADAACLLDAAHLIYFPTDYRRSYRSVAR